jgi:hypothetical protein
MRAYDAGSTHRGKAPGKVFTRIVWEISSVSGGFYLRDSAPGDMRVYRIPADDNTHTQKAPHFRTLRQHWQAVAQLGEVNWGDFQEIGWVAVLGLKLLNQAVDKAKHLATPFQWFWFGMLTLIIDHYRIVTFNLFLTKASFRF